ncbi:MAG TPA: hypothetical protein PL002_14240, partial [Flavobacteriales bacterium]|nr:hypothetical protein [Flavobacteriales bacterium]
SPRIGAKLDDRLGPSPYFRRKANKSTFRMRHISTAILLVALSTGAWAQGINSVVITPQNPTTCTLIHIQFNGSMPQQANLTNFTSTISGDTMYVTFFASGNGGQNTSFTQGIDLMAPSAGTWVIQTGFVLNGNQVGLNTQTINVAVGVTSDPGEYGELTGLCTGGTAIPLISILGGTPDPGGSWTDPLGQVVPNGQFVPGQSPAGFYIYNFDVNPPCNDTAQYIYVDYVTPSAIPGLNATVQVCENWGGTVNLFDTLGGTPDTGGTWTAPGGAPHSAVYDPLTDPCGAYTYTVPGIAPCPAATATITIQCVSQPNAGSVSAANDTINRCYNDTSEVLSQFVTGEQNTGTWYNGAGFAAGPYNAHINIAANGPGTYVYVVPGGVCPNDSTFIHVVLWGDSIVGCTVGMDEPVDGFSRFELMPNPAQDQVTIELERDRDTGPAWIEITGVDGKVLRRASLTFNGLFARTTLGVGDLPRGACIVRVMGDQGALARRLMLR